MKKRLTIVLIILLNSLLGISQVNLIPNHDFEYNTQCNPAIYLVNPVPPWYDPNKGSADFLTPCNDTAGYSSYSTPNNQYGYQVPHSGISYTLIGFAINWDTVHNREYISTRLLDTLKNGKKYCCNFYVSLANKSQFAIAEIGAFFSNDSIYSDTSAAQLLYNPQVCNNSSNIISDTLNWVSISGDFIAKGGECFITIGCFFSNENINYIDVGGPNLYEAAYYIDDVSVIYCDTDTTGFSEFNSQYYLSQIYPNPVFDIASLDYSIADNINAQLNVFDVTGNLIKSFTLRNNDIHFEFSTQYLQSGVYFYNITLTSGDILQSNKMVIVK
jgi:hypothetical protein